MEGILLVVAVASEVAWFDQSKLSTFIIALVSIIIVLYTTYHKKSRDKYQVRRIAGLSAIDDAVGRATEMARPLLFTPGWGGDIQRPTTIASMNILANVSAKTAQYGCSLIYPTHDPVIQAVAQEVVREGYARAGFPDRYRAEDIAYVTSSQFGYAAAVDGMIARLKPNSVGAIQIAGTDSTIQLSFFIVACDYTLIGEELFAASGYLSGDKSILASVRAQDMLKVLIAVFIIVAVIWSTISAVSGGGGEGWWNF